MLLYLAPRLFLCLFYSERWSYTYTEYLLVSAYIQELVNLLLTGKAVSNVFDGVINLDTGAGQTVGVFCCVFQFHLQQL